MSQITLESIEAKQAEVAKMLEQFKQQAAAAPLVLPAATITLRPGERYAGALIDESGKVKRHLVLLPARPEDDLNWNDAKAWAAEAGGELPSREEAWLLLANCRDVLPQRWCWLNNLAEGSSSAWYCTFGHGNQNCLHQGSEGGAVAVRRLNP